MASRRAFLATSFGIGAGLLGSRASAGVGNMPQIQRRPPRIAPDLDRGPLTAYIGDSIEQGSSQPFSFGGDCYPTIVGLITGQRIRTYVNAGGSGQTTAQIMARLHSDVLDLDLKPARCVVGGGTNDLNGLRVAMESSEADGLAKADEIFGNLAWMYDETRGAGIEPIGRTIPPHHTLPPVSPQNDARQVEYLNAGIKRLCDQRGMHCIDIHSVLVARDGSGEYLDGYTADGSHPVGPGLLAIANLFNTVLAPRYPISTLPPANATGFNGIDNGLFLDDADLDGVPDNWSFGGEGGDTTCTIETGDSNIVGNWVVLTTTESGDGPRTFSQQHSATAGDVLEMFGLITTEVEEGASAPSVRIDFNNATNQIAFYRLAVDVTRGVFYRLCVVPEGATGYAFTLIHSEVSPRGAGVVKLAQPTVINWTRLGLA